MQERDLPRVSYRPDAINTGISLKGGFLRVAQYYLEAVLSILDSRLKNRSAVRRSLQNREDPKFCERTLPTLLQFGIATIAWV